MLLLKLISSLAVGGILMFVTNYIFNKNWKPKVTAVTNTNRPIINSSPTQHPICVIGAGISGLNIANLLQEKGYPVQAFEKKSVVGGKVVTFRIPGEIQVEMCPLIFSSATSHLLTKKLNQFKLTSVPFDGTDNAQFNPRNGHVYPKVTMKRTPAQINAINSYIHFRSVVHKRDLESYGNLNVSSELFVPMSTWLRSRGLEALKPDFSLIVTSEGYGHLDDVPALYVLKLADESMVAGSDRGGIYFSVKEGLDVLVDRMAESLKSVTVNKEVVKIERGRNNRVRITFHNNDKRVCSKVILAFPPLLPNVEKILPDLTNQERVVLDQVKIHKYVSGANYIPTLNKTLYYEREPLLGNGEVIAFIKQSPQRRQNIYSSYSWIRGDFDRTATNDELLNINRQLRSTIQRLSKNQGQTFLLQSSEYFPHVNTQALQSGFYQAFDSLQGVGGIYYATTLLEFEIIERALKMTEGFVQRFF